MSYDDSENPYNHEMNEKWFAGKGSNLVNHLLLCLWTRGHSRKTGSCSW